MIILFRFLFNKLQFCSWGRTQFVEYQNKIGTNLQFRSAIVIRGHYILLIDLEIKASNLNCETILLTSANLFTDPLAIAIKGQVS